MCCYSFEVSWLSLIPRLFRTNSSFVILFLMPPIDDVTCFFHAKAFFGRAWIVKIGLKHDQREGEHLRQRLSLLQHANIPQSVRLWRAETKRINKQWCLHLPMAYACIKYSHVCFFAGMARMRSPHWQNGQDCRCSTSPQTSPSCGRFSEPKLLWNSLSPTWWVKDVKKQFEELDWIWLRQHV